MDKSLSEFRQDLVSGDWVLFSTGRKHSIRKFEDSYQPKAGCPFEDLAGSEHEVVLEYPDSENWEAAVIKNKYPAVKPTTDGGVCGPDFKNGPFSMHDGVGEHDLVIFRNHDVHFADFSVEQAVGAIRVYKRRYGQIAETGGCTEYIMIFHNFGIEAGASIYHPHSQIISLPIIPPDVSRSLNGSHDFYRQNKKRVYDVMIEWEKKQNKRIVYENDFFIAFCPFVSKTPYEVRIFSKESHAHFEKMPDELDEHLADALLAILKKVKKALNSPPYNFFIHTAPVETADNNIHEYYHWHIEILPKLKMTAGFELGTGIEINVVDPDRAAEELRNA